MTEGVAVRPEGSAVNPISAINTYASGPIVGSGLSPQQPTSVTSGGGISSTPETQLSGLSQINQAVSQMLEGVGGGGLENNQMVRALIGMIILLALIEQLLGGGSGQDSGQNELDRLGGGLGGSGESASLFHSSTSVSIEYTSTTIVSGSMYTDAPSDVSGQALDEAG